MQKMMFLGAETPKFSACGEPKRAIFPYKNLILPLKTPKIFRLRRAQTGPDRIWGSYYFEFLNKSRIGGLIILSFQNNLEFGGLIILRKSWSKIPIFFRARFARPIYKAKSQKFPGALRAPIIQA